MAKLVSKTYGEALYGVAMEAGEDRAVQLMEEIRCVIDVLAQNPEFDGLMRHPGIPKQEKIQVVDNVFTGRVSDDLKNFLKIVTAKERYSDLNDIFEYYIARVKEEQKIGVAFVKTAVELTAEQKDAVEAKILETSGYRKMEMNFSVDPAIIGGMIVRINDRVVDSSIRTKLDGLTKQLLQIQLG